MINRVLIRIKVLQIAYACLLNSKKGLGEDNTNGINLEWAEQELLFSLTKGYDLYTYLLQLMVSINDLAEKRIENRRNKHLPTSSDLNPDTKFINNRFIKQLSENKQLQKLIEQNKRNWNNEDIFLRTLLDDIENSSIFKDYMALEETTYEIDKELWRKIYKNFIQNNEKIDNILEEQSLYWNDDKTIIDTFVIKTIKKFNEQNGEEQALLPEYRDDEDREFAVKLLRETLINTDEYAKIISDRLTKGWELERIQFMDFVILNMALAELFEIPNIPVPVTVNEYVELAKIYSGKKNANFVNGLLDKMINDYKKEGKLNKF